MKEIQCQSFRSSKPKRLEVRPVRKVDYSRSMVIANIIMSALITYILFDVGWILCDTIVQVVVAVIGYMILITYVLNWLGRVVAGDWR